jgi:UTP--glucose-1-phosphate uridylyltransferase
VDNKINNKITKAVFPVAGLGTRFLPATKANPKEMLPVVDKPLIQYAVDEAIAAGIKELIFVTSWSKRAIEDHFDKNFELEFTLQERGKHKLLEDLHNLIPKDVRCVYVRQPEALGLGHAVLCAKTLIKDEPFAVLLADDLIWSEPDSVLSTMVDVYNKNKASGVVAVQTVRPSETDQYGIVEIEGLEHRIKGIVEKPKKEEAPSNLGVVGRYILPPEIFSSLERVKKGAGGEIQLTDAISDLLKDYKIHAHLFDGKRYDCGSKLGYLQANIDYALRSEELGADIRDYISNIS